MRRWNGRRPPAPGCDCCGDAAIGRRALLGAVTALACTGPSVAQVARGGARRLTVRRAYAGESFSGVYFQDGRYVRDALERLNLVFRDLSRDEVTPMDPRLFDVMHAVAERLGTDAGFDVISGYRTPESNAGLAQRSGRVSPASLHMSGMAGDMRIPGRESLGVARLAAEMGLGGVGLYRRDGFVHLDCGQARRW